jgi:transmembrane sensor
MDYRQLFTKYVEGNIDKSDLLRLIEYLESKPKEEFDHITKDLWDTNGHKHLPGAQELLGKINQKIRPSKYRLSYHLTPMRVAAAVVLLMLSGAILFFIGDSHVDKSTIAQVIVKTNPLGQKSKIFLPDGSMIMLNSGSSISYPESFTDSLRAVTLEGEAFFEVKTNSKKPFQVYSQGVLTTVLGTSFNIKAYPEEEYVTVALATGKILVQATDEASTGEEIILEPGSAISYSVAENRFSRHNYVYNQELGWKDGIIYFDHASRTEVFNILSRWYGVEFTEENQPSDVEWKYSSQFKNEYLENVLESIGFSKNFTYRISNKKVTVKYH